MIGWLASNPVELSRRCMEPRSILTARSYVLAKSPRPSQRGTASNAALTRRQQDFTRPFCVSSAAIRAAISSPRLFNRSDEPQAKIADHHAGTKARLVAKATTARSATDEATRGGSLLTDSQADLVRGVIEDVIAGA
jgi:hypothetical protein